MGKLEVAVIEVKMVDTHIRWSHKCKKQARKCNCEEM